MKDQAIVCSIGHFDNGIQVDNVKPQSVQRCKTELDDHLERAYQQCMTPQMSNQRRTEI
jgi:S-adenosylhomocysteine hydrolase